MSNFPRFHGIKLAAGGTIENLHLERLNADPVPAQAGRFWFNVTEKAVKYSSLSALGAVVVLTLASGEAAAALADRVTTLEQAVASIGATYIKKDGSVAFEGNVNIGSNRVINMAAPIDDTDGANKKFVVDSIAALGNAFEYVGSVEGGATAPAAFDLAGLTKKQAGDYYKVTTAGHFKLAAETFYANVGDGLVFNVSGGVDKIDNTDSNVTGTVQFITVTGSADTGFTVDIATEFKGRVDALESGLAAEISRSTGADLGHSTRLDAAEGAINALQGQQGTTAQGLADEIARATAAEGVLTNAVATEKSRAELAEGGLQTAINNEAIRATAAENAISNKVGDLTGLTTTEKGTVVGALNEVRALVGGGIGDLTTRLSAERFRFKSVAPALTHVVAHNLNSEYVQVTLMVKGEDGVFRNDIVAYEETDSNTITVFLTEALNIKCAIASINAL